jgi:four helix bundle protein
MDDTTFLPHQRTDIYQAAMQLCVSVREARIRDAELRDQAQRASVSTFLAVSEGLPHASPRMRKQYFERARASAWEVASAIHLAKELLDVRVLHARHELHRCLVDVRPLVWKSGVVTHPGLLPKAKPRRPGLVMS